MVIVALNILLCQSFLPETELIHITIEIHLALKRSLVSDADAVVIIADDR